MQNRQGALTGFVVFSQLSDSLKTETAPDGDIQVVQATANDVRTTNLGITKKYVSVIDQTTLGSPTLGPLIAAGVPMTCTSVSCTSFTVSGGPVTGGGGVSIIVNYKDDISASSGNLAGF